RVIPNTALIVNAADGVLKNDTDVDSANLTAAKTSSPTHGSLAFSSDGSFTYTPNTGFAGTDKFTYVVSDDATPAGQSNTVTVQLIVNSAPVTQNDSFTTNEDAALNINAPGVLANDTDANNDPMTVGIIGQPTHGTVTLNSNGSFAYTPTTNYAGPDSF